MTGSRGLSGALTTLLGVATTVPDVVALLMVAALAMPVVGKRGTDDSSDWSVKG